MSSKFLPEFDQIWIFPRYPSKSSV